MGANIEAHSQTLQRVRYVGTLGPKWDVFITSLPSELRETYGRGGGEIVRASGNGEH